MEGFLKAEYLGVKGGGGRLGLRGLGMTISVTPKRIIRQCFAVIYEIIGKLNMKKDSDRDTILLCVQQQTYTRELT